MKSQKKFTWEIPCVINLSPDASASAVAWGGWCNPGTDGGTACAAGDAGGHCCISGSTAVCCDTGSVGGPLTP